MATKVGRIKRLGRTGSKFKEAFLDSGEVVNVPHDLMAYLMESYSPDQTLVFVERRGRFFRFVQWLGTVEEARAARDAGLLTPEEVPI